jgi:alkylation response protein AidB-like acyl-CoA dehydrogenase
MNAYPQIPLDFGFKEEHELLRQSARRLLGERCTLKDVRRIADGGAAHDESLWKEITGLGWTGVAFSEADGGAGMGFLPLALLLDETGRALLPSPLLACLLAGFALESAGDADQRARWLVPIASGELIATLAFCETEGAWLPDDLRATAEPSGGGFVLRGTKPFVMHGAQAKLVVAPFREPDGRLSLFCVDLPSAGVTIDAETGIDPTRRTARLRFDGVRVGADAKLAHDGRRALARIHERAFVALAAEMVGGAEATLGITREYAIARTQFGHQIGYFQAVKHPVVDVMTGVELARTHVLGAAAAIDHVPDACAVPARMAKAIISDVYAHAVRKGVQLHGGYGFTWDCDVHYFFKRALWSRAMFGDAVHHRRHLGALLMEDGTA